jgi:hypothetical protein
MTDSSLVRGRPFVRRYYEGRREVFATIPRDADPTRLYQEFARAALPDVAQWIAIVSSTGSELFANCVAAHDHSLEACATVHRTNPRDIDVTPHSRTGSLDASGHLVSSTLFVDDREVGVIVVGRAVELGP